nr:OmpA family protein [uncultured Bacteroides sp.]
MKRKLLFVCFLLALLQGRVNAQTTDDTITVHTANGWYVGASGGVPFGVSTFSSFGADKTRFGWAASAFGGYRFNPVLSLELFAKAGQTTLAVRENDVNANYWLGNDIVRYYAPVIDMVGWDYNNLTSKVNFQQYGLQGNINLPGLFCSGSNCRWIFELSPAISAVSTRADFFTIAENEKVVDGKTKWHLGIGGNVQAGYRVAKHLSVGIYGGITHLTGEHFDKLPEHLYKDNFMYEGGVKLTWSFGKDVQRKGQPVPTPAYIPVAKEEVPTAPQKEQITEPEKPQEEKTVEKVEIIPDKVEEKKSISFPTIYFEFNRSFIEVKEQPKLKEILSLLRKNPDMKITITGWCDTVGTRAINLRFSLRRAQRVKSWLVQQGIEASRISIIGKGSDFNEKIPAKARRTETKESKEDKK